MSPKRFFISALATTLVMVVAVWTLAYWLQPLYGDLTRIGGFAERDFGGNKPMQEFRPPIVTYGTYDKPADVLVIGDSFANVWPHQQWQNWLALKTGWYIHTMNIHQVELNALLSSKIYRQFPPKVVIWNVVERDLRDEYGSSQEICKKHINSVKKQPLEIHPRNYLPTYANRPRHHGLNPGFAREWIRQTLLREVFGQNSTNTIRIKLARDDLFSSKASDQLLVYRNDLRKERWRPADLVRIRCSFSNLAAKIQANGLTYFVSAIAPDKSSAYRPWLVSPSVLPESRLSLLMENFPIPDARLDQVLSRAIAEGTKDVYMPDDTHWNATGQKLVAEAILAMLTAEGLTR